MERKAGRIEGNKERPFVLLNRRDLRSFSLSASEIFPPALKKTWENVPHLGTEYSVAYCNVHYHSDVFWQFGVSQY